MVNVTQCGLAIINKSYLKKFYELCLNPDTSDLHDGHNRDMYENLGARFSFLACVSHPVEYL